jgi:hypothetical protein
MSRLSQESLQNESVPIRSSANWVWVAWDKSGWRIGPLRHLAVIEEHEGKRDEALKLLREAIEHGLPPEEALDIETDPDLKTLHNDPRFAALVADVKKRATTVARKTPKDRVTLKTFATT